MQRKNPLPLLLAAAALAAGCASTVRVRTEPAGGARVWYRGEGRPTFRWKQAPGTAPTEFRAYYSAVKVWAVWPGTGAQSAIETVSLSNWRDPDEIVLRADPSLPRVAGASSAGFVPRPAGYDAAPAFDPATVRKDGGRAELPPPKLELPPPAGD